MYLEDCRRLAHQIYSFTTGFMPYMKQILLQYIYVRLQKYSVISRGLFLVAHPVWSFTENALYLHQSSFRGLVLRCYDTFVGCKPITLSKYGRKSDFAPGKISLAYKRPRKHVYIYIYIFMYCTSPRECGTSCNISLTSINQGWCSKEAKTRNPLKSVGVPQTRQPISATSGSNVHHIVRTCGGDIAV